MEYHFAETRCSNHRLLAGRHRSSKSVSNDPPRHSWQRQRVRPRNLPFRTSGDRFFMLHGPAVQTGERDNAGWMVGSRVWARPLNLYFPARFGSEEDRRLGFAAPGTPEKKSPAGRSRRGRTGTADESVGALGKRRGSMPSSVVGKPVQRCFVPAGLPLSSPSRRDCVKREGARPGDRAPPIRQHRRISEGYAQRAGSRHRRGLARR